MQINSAKFVIASDVKKKVADPVKMPLRVTEEDATEWVKHVLVRSRGKEPVGSYNPLIIGELFWEQSIP